MRRYVILTNRKRAIIALVHTVAFLALAVATGTIAVQSLHAGSQASAWIVAGIFLLVTMALLALTAISGSFRERLYFACCTTSAGFGWRGNCSATSSSLPRSTSAWPCCAAPCFWEL
jgi:hypothetical protein